MSLSDLTPRWATVFGRSPLREPERSVLDDQARRLVRTAFRPTQMPEYLRVIIRRTQTRLDVLGASGELEVCGLTEELCLEASCGLMAADFRPRMRPDFWRHFEGAARHQCRWAERLLRERIADIMFERCASPAAHSDFIQSLADARSATGAPLPIERLTAIIVSVLLAANNATLERAKWTLVWLLLNPGRLSQIVQEQDAVLGWSTSSITVASVARLHQLQLAIDTCGSRGAPDDRNREIAVACLTIKTIFSMLLQRYAFELAAPPSPRDSRCLVRYTRRAPTTTSIG